MQKMPIAQCHRDVALLMHNDNDERLIVLKFFISFELLEY